MPAKTNNRRIYPDSNRQPHYKTKLRLESAKERQADYDTLTIQQKLDLLDTRLGKGVGATKQRARLLAEQNKPKPQPKKDVTPIQPGEETKATKEPKDYQHRKYMKGSK